MVQSARLPPAPAGHIPPPRRPHATALRAHRLTQIYARAPEAEGRFWYSVVTTGVYCRPGCPSRKARPQNIRLHETLEEARATGFRPCRRCGPEGPALRERQRALIRIACGMIETRDGVSAQGLAHATGLSRSQFHRLFKRETGVTPGAFAASLRRRTA